MSGDAWNMQSNIKAKPGSQGTLFQPASKNLLNPMQRWPKGYTPERLNEVREGLKRTPITHPDRMEDEHEPGDYREMMGYRERLTRTIAKSTVPAEHLEGLKEIHGQPDADDHGTYWPGRKTIGVDMTAAPDMDRTLIHEIGHHVHNDGTTSHGSMEARTAISKAAEKQAWKEKSKYHDAPTRSGVLMAENTVQAGVHEALADNYMTEHYRTGGRKSKPVTDGQYERNFTNARLDQRYPGYTDVRPPALGPQFHDDHIEGLGAKWGLEERDRTRAKREAQSDANRWAVGH